MVSTHKLLSYRCLASSNLVRTCRPLPRFPTVRVFFSFVLYAHVNLLEASHSRESFANCDRRLVDRLSKINRGGRQ